MSGGEASTPKNAVATTYTAASERIRDSAKWLVATFGAVGAAVFAGVALSDLGRISDRWLFGLAIGFAVVAALGVIAAIVAAGGVVTTSYANLWTLRDSEDDANMLAGFSLSQFREGWAEARKAAFDARLTYGKAYSAETVDAGTEKLALKALATEAERKAYEALAIPFLEQKSFERVREAYIRARIKIGCGALATFVGIIGFVAITKNVTPRAPVIGTVPVQVKVEIKESARDKYRRILGSDCELSAVSGTAIGTHGDIVVVAVPSSGTCNETLLTLTPAEAAVVASHS